MLMPVLRLIGIYVVVGLAIFGLFNRDKISELFGFGNEVATIEETIEPQNNSDTTENVETVRMASSVDNTTTHQQASEAVPSTQVAVEQSTPTALEQPVSPQSEQSQPIQQVDLADQLDNARRAFWNGDVNGAETLYRQLVKQHPDSADANGELGNILFSSQRMNEAAVYYHAVGEIAQRSGNTAQLMNMIGVLQGIASEKAEQLRALSNTTN